MSYNSRMGSIVAISEEEGWREDKKQAKRELKKRRVEALEEANRLKLREVEALERLADKGGEPEGLAGPVNDLDRAGQSALDGSPEEGT